MNIRILIVIMFFICSVMGQNRHSEISQRQINKSDANIVGHVIDVKTSEHIPFVNISIKGTTIGVSCDGSGHFALNNLPIGEHILMASAVGYKKVERAVNIQRGKTIEVNIELEEESIEMDAVVVTANRGESNRREASTIVNVINSKTFDVTASTTMADVLNYQPGLRVEYKCNNCGVPQLRINGLEGQYSQILMDSRPIFSSLASVYGLEQLPTDMVERAEVIRGGGSALFGSSAIGGVVNIITKEPVRNSLMISNTSALIGGSAYDITTALNGSFVSDNSKAGVFIFGVLRNRSSYDRNEDGFSEIPELSSNTIGFRGYYKTSNYSKLTAEYHHVGEFRRGGNKFDLPPHEADIAEQLDHQIDAGSLKFDMFSKNNRHRFSIYSSVQGITRKSYFGTGQDLNAYGRTSDFTVVAGGQYRYAMNKCWFMPAELTGGVEYSHNSLHDFMIGYNRDILQKIDVIGAYAQNEWKNDKFTFLLGFRLDKHNMIKNPVFSPRINFRYTPIEGIVTRASYSSGYRAPQAYEEDLHVAAVGGEVALITIDPNLKPEYSNSVSASVDLYKNFGNVQTSLLVEGFYTSLDNVFVLEENGRDEMGNLLLERRNASGAYVGGLNIEGKIAMFNKLSFQLGYTYQQSRYKKPFTWSENPNITPQTKMFRTPDNYGYITVSYNPIKPLSLSLSGIYTGSMLVQHYEGYISEDQETVTKGFWDMGFKVSYDIKLYGNIKLQVNGGVKNIFDSFQSDLDYGELKDAGYIYGPAMPRTYYIGLKFMI